MSVPPSFRVDSQKVTIHPSTGEKADECFMGGVCGGGVGRAGYLSRLTYAR